MRRNAARVHAFNQGTHTASFWLRFLQGLGNGLGLAGLLFLSLSTQAADVTSIAIAPTNPTVAVGAIQPFTATGTFSDGSTRSLTNSTLAAGLDYTCALLPNGSVQCWGYNLYGQLGNGTNTSSNVPVSVSNLTNVTAIDLGAQHTCALLADKTVKCWGHNGSGQLGNGTYTNSNVPVAVSL